MGWLTKSWRPSSECRRPLAQARKLKFEPLENRRMLTLLGICRPIRNSPTTAPARCNYTASSDTFLITANPLTFTNVTPPPHIVTTPRSLTVDIEVDNSGNLVAGSGTANDLVVDGTVDPNGAGPDPTDSGQLLTGEITAFGYAGAGPMSAFDMRFTVTGGLMASYFAGDDIGMTVGAENSESFNGNFNAGFHRRRQGDHRQHPDAGHADAW